MKRNTKHILSETDICDNCGVAERYCRCGDWCSTYRPSAETLAQVATLEEEKRLEFEAEGFFEKT